MDDLWNIITFDIVYVHKNINTKLEFLARLKYVIVQL